MTVEFKLTGNKLAVFDRNVGKVFGKATQAPSNRFQSFKRTLLLCNGRPVGCL